MSYYLDYLRVASEILFKYVENWPFGVIAGALLFVALGLTALMIAKGIYHAIDFWFPSLKKEVGIVNQKKLVPKHTQAELIYFTATKMKHNKSTRYPDKWCLGIEVVGKHCIVAVDENVFHSISRGGYILVEYIRGRLSGRFFLKDVYNS